MVVPRIRQAFLSLLMDSILKTRMIRCATHFHVVDWQTPVKYNAFSLPSKQTYSLTAFAKQNDSSLSSPFRVVGVVFLDASFFYFVETKTKKPW